MRSSIESTQLTKLKKHFGMKCFNNKGYWVKNENKDKSQCDSLPKIQSSNINKSDVGSPPKRDKDSSKISPRLKKIYESRKSQHFHIMNNFLLV